MKHLMRLAVLAIIGVPFISSAATAAELQAQAQLLLQQVAALQAQLAAQTGATVAVPASPVLGGGTVTPTSCPSFATALKYGSSGSDVTLLQQFLARDPSVYPEGQVSGYFGSLTQAAVQRWQAKYGVVSSGSPETTGYGVVGPRTAALIAQQCTGSASASGGSAPGGAPTVGGFIQVSPITGQAPLSVTVVANVNTVASCASAVYQLNWGDGSAIQTITVPANSCAQLSQTYKHLYIYGGTYTVTLSASGHQTTATVVVSGAGAPITIGTGGTITQNLPAETVSAAPTSGQSPLIVTFSGVVTGADQGWCASGCTSTLDYGDGTTGRVVLPIATNGSQSFSLQHTYSTAGTYTAKLYQGTANSGRPLVGSPMTITVSVNPSNYSYGPLSVTPNVSGNPLATTASFDLPSACTGYDFSWGDGSQDIIQPDGGSSCAAGIITKTVNHIYAGAGTYAITVRRGPSLAKQDTVSLVISN